MRNEEPSTAALRHTMIILEIEDLWPSSGLRARARARAGTQAHNIRIRRTE